MVDESSIKVISVDRKVICLANLILVIQRLVVELVEDYNALECEDDLGYIPEVLVGLSDGHSGISVSVRPCP